MTARTRFHRTTIATLLVLTMLIAPAVPAAADEVGSGWTQGIADLVGTWIANLGWPTQVNADNDVREGVGSTQQALKPHPRTIPEGRDKGEGTDVLPPMIIPHAQEEHTCDALPETDPLGQC